MGFPGMVRSRTDVKAVLHKEARQLTETWPQSIVPAGTMGEGSGGACLLSPVQAAAAGRVGG